MLIRLTLVDLDRPWLECTAGIGAFAVLLEFDPLGLIEKSFFGNASIRPTSVATGINQCPPLLFNPASATLFPKSRMPLSEIARDSIRDNTRAISDGAKEDRPGNPALII